jgi:hypothetical protein
MHATGAGLSDQLAFALGAAVDLQGCADRARHRPVSPARRARTLGYLTEKVIIWCFA